MLMAYEDKSAYALCSFSFAIAPDAEPIAFLGTTPVCRQNVLIPNISGLPLLLYSSIATLVTKLPDLTII